MPETESFVQTYNYSSEKVYPVVRMGGVRYIKNSTEYSGALAVAEAINDTMPSLTLNGVVLVAGADQYALTLAKMQSVDSSIETNRADIGILRTNISTINGNITTIGGRLDTIDGSVVTLSGRCDGFDSALVTMDSSIAALETFKSNVESSISTIDGKVTGLEASVVTIDSSVSSIGTSISSIESSISDLSGSVTTLDSSVSSVETTVSGIQTSISTIDTSISTLNTTVSSLSSYHVSSTIVSGATGITTGDAIDAKIAAGHYSCSIIISDDSSVALLNTGGTLFVATNPEGTSLYQRLSFMNVSGEPSVISDDVYTRTGTKADNTVTWGNWTKVGA